MLRKNELKSLIAAYLHDFWDESGAYTKPDIEAYAKAILKDILACLSPPTSKD